MRYDYDLRGFSGGRWHGRRSAKGFIEWATETQSFNHLTDDVIRGWLQGRFEIEVFGQREKSSSYYVEVECSKCKGRGWFGRGRKDCPECVAVGEKPIWKERRWKGGKKFTGEDKRYRIWSEYNLDLLDDKSSEVKYAKAFDRAVSHSEEYYPAWIDDVQITGEYTDKDRTNYLERIKQSFTFYREKPKVKGVIDRGREMCERKIDPRETIIRLAMTFGCTCPVTGEYIPPDQVATIKESIDHLDVYDYKYDVVYDFARLVEPLGFSEFTRISWVQPSGRSWYFNCVSPFSEHGKKIINRAATKCLKVMDGKINNEWVLAEVMQSAILKRVA